MIDCLIDRLFAWSIDCLIDRLFGWLVAWLIDWLSIARMIDHPFDRVLDWLTLYITHVAFNGTIPLKRIYKRLLRARYLQLDRKLYYFPSKIGWRSSYVQKIQPTFIQLSGVYTQAFPVSDTDEIWRSRACTPPVVYVTLHSPPPEQLLTSNHQRQRLRTGRHQKAKEPINQSIIQSIR